jgi:Mrp family chromosome partitioning ATPase
MVDRRDYYRIVIPGMLSCLCGRLLALHVAGAAAAGGPGWRRRIESLERKPPVAVGSPAPPRRMRETTMDEWASSAEQIAISQIIKGTRLLGFVSPTADSGTSLLARMVAEAMGRADVKTLLANLNTTQNAIRGGAAVAVSVPWQPIRGDTNDLIDVLTANVTAETRPVFNNNGWLASFFAEQLRTYSTVILDLPPLLDEQKSRLSPLAAASVCQAVILTCPTGSVTRPQLATSLQLLDSADANVIGLVVEEDQDKSGWRDFRFPAKGASVSHAQNPA